MTFRTLILAGLLAGLTSAAHAGRPLITEDAGVLDARDCELELVGSRERAGGDLPTARGASAQLGCGVGLSTQIALFAGRAKADGERADALALVGKTVLRALTETQGGVVIAWSVGGERSGGSFRHETTELKAVFTQPVDQWLLHANLGWTRSESARQNGTLWSVAAERTGLGPFDAMAEVFGDDRDEPWLNAGLRWTAIADRLFVDASYGVQMNSARARLATIGLKFAF